MEERYLRATYYMDYEHESVKAYAIKHGERGETDLDKVLDLYYAIRDEFLYTPYKLILKPEAMKASFMLTKNYGNCIEKANLLAACTRYWGIPTRLGFANVRNHIGTEKLQEFLKTDLMVFHGYADIHLDGQWVKATPAFNKSMCEKLNVAPLEFDGKSDSIFQEYDKAGSQFMVYEEDLGVHDDLPFDRFVAELKKHYGHLFTNDNRLKIQEAP